MPITADASRPVPSAGSVLGRSLIIWGWGDITLGDRRGWLFVILQALAIFDWLEVATQLIDGTLWLVVFVPLVLMMVFWVWQAVRAYRRALALGGAPGGELQLALFLPLVLAVFTSFWLVGGRHGSAASTVEAYMDAWESDRPDVAVTLTADQDLSASEVASFWDVKNQSLRGTIATGSAQYGPSSGLDPLRPFSSLRVTQSGDTRFDVTVVRSETFKTTLLGMIPTSGVRTVAVAHVMTIVVAEEPVAGVLPSTAWRIDQYTTSRLSP